MKIGILAYHAAYNFGANLQIYSTVGYLSRMGYNPIVINWVSEDLEIMYESTVPKIQAIAHKKFVLENLQTTKICRNEFDIAKVIENEGIQAIIIGSDAVVQHHPLFSRLVFPTKKIFSFVKHTSDRKFPNPFWGNFLDHLSIKIPIAFLSVSSQNSSYKLLNSSTRSQINIALSKFSFISVRDEWTKSMFEHITKGMMIPAITPDPVFAFNYNCIENQHSKEYIINKYSLPEKYILLSFLDNKTVSRSWLNQFEILAKEKGYECIALPFPKGILFDNGIIKKIDLPLSPLEWYSLIKYSSGYVGHNMHPIIVSLHNSVPFFSFDHYGIVNFKYFVNEKSSKIFHILKRADFLGNRSSSASRFSKQPSSKYVFSKIINFEKAKCKNFANQYFKEYEIMMDKICKSLNL